MKKLASAIVVAIISRPPNHVRTVVVGVVIISIIIPILIIVVSVVVVIIIIGVLVVGVIIRIVATAAEGLRRSKVLVVVVGWSLKKLPNIYILFIYNNCPII